MRISNCFIESVDDAIALKTTLAERRSTEHVTVTNCVLRTASIHLKCGTESCGDFRNIAFSNCTLVGGMGMRHGNPGVALYTVDGGVLEDIVVSNITMRDVGIPLAILRGNRDRCNFGGAPGNVGGIRDLERPRQRCETAQRDRRPRRVHRLPGFASMGFRFRRPLLKAVRKRSKQSPKSSRIIPIPPCSARCQRTDCSSVTPKICSYATFISIAPLMRNARRWSPPMPSACTLANMKDPYG